MITRFQSLVVLLVVLAPFYMGADAACVASPLQDTLVGTSTVQVEGFIFDENLNRTDGQIMLQVNGVPLPPVSTEGGRYVSEVPLELGVSLIDGSSVRQAGETEITGQLPVLRIQRRDDLVDRGTQQYFLDFRDPAYQQQVRDFIAQTVDRPLSPEQLDALLEQVNNRIRERFRVSYSLLGLRIVEVGAPGPDVSEVFFDGVTADPNTPFGRAPLDYGNRIKRQIGRVFVARIRQFFLDRGLIFFATPARSTDTPEQRAIDIGNLLSGVGVHELNHTLGLVADGPELLDGCDTSHNCPAFDRDNPFANRFDSGRFFMDVDRTAASDFGSASATMRIERLMVQNPFNFGYLKILHGGSP
jgi:hypothetical protein